MGQIPASMEVKPNLTWIFNGRALSLPALPSISSPPLPPRRPPASTSPPCTPSTTISPVCSARALENVSNLLAPPEISFTTRFGNKPLPKVLPSSFLPEIAAPQAATTSIPSRPQIWAWPSADLPPRPSTLPSGERTSTKSAGNRNSGIRHPLQPLHPYQPPP